MSPELNIKYTDPPCWSGSTTASHPNAFRYLKPLFVARPYYVFVLNFQNCLTSKTTLIPVRNTLKKEVFRIFATKNNSYLDHLADI